MVQINFYKTKKQKNCFIDLDFSTNTTDGYDNACSIGCCRIVLSINDVADRSPHVLLKFKTKSHSPPLREPG